MQIHASMYDPWCVAAVINDWTSRARQTGVHAAGMQQPGTNFEKCRGFYRLTPVRKSSSSTPPFGGKARDRVVFFSPSFRAFLERKKRICHSISHAAGNDGGGYSPLTRGRSWRQGD